MLLTIHMSENETANYQRCAATRAYLRAYALRTARERGRRFAQLVLSGGGIAAVVEVRQLTARLRELNEAFAHPEGGPGSVYLYWQGPAHCGLVEGVPQPMQLPHDLPPSGEWRCDCEPWEARVGPEEVPGDKTFDAVGAARRLLADARAKGYK